MGQLALSKRFVWTGWLASLVFTGTAIAQRPPLPSDQSDPVAQPRSLRDPVEVDEAPEWEDNFVHPAEIAKEAFAAPPEAKPLGNQNLWIDRGRQRVYIDGYVTMREGPLEMFACPVGTKEHESIVATLPTSQQVHAALLAIGAKSGTPVSFIPKFVPATGQRIRVWVCYRDDSDKFQVIDARQWVEKLETGDHQQQDWVFGGSSFWTDPQTGRQYYQADGGDLICVSNFTTAMMDVPIASSADAGHLMYGPFTKRIPPRGTPVRLVLVPIPLPTDASDQRAPIHSDQPPGEEVLPERTEPQP